MRDLSEDARAANWSAWRDGWTVSVPTGYLSIGERVSVDGEVYEVDEFADIDNEDRVDALLRRLTVEEKLDV